MNLPNKLSILRIILIPIMLLFMLPIPNEIFSTWNQFVSTNGMIIALIIFVIASYTDHLDGKIAREKNMVTDLGKFLDPIADKMLTLSAFIAFAVLGRTSAWFPIIILFRELAITGLRSIAATKGVVIAAQSFGKIKAVVQMFTVIFMMLENILICKAVNPEIINIATIIVNLSLIFTIVFTIVSGIEYLRTNKNLLKE